MTSTPTLATVNATIATIATLIGDIPRIAVVAASSTGPFNLITIKSGRTARTFATIEDAQSAADQAWVRAMAQTYGTGPA